MLVYGYGDLQQDSNGQWILPAAFGGMQDAQTGAANAGGSIGLPIGGNNGSLLGGGGNVVGIGSNSLTGLGGGSNMSSSFASAGGGGSTGIGGIGGGIGGGLPTGGGVPGGYASYLDYFRALLGMGAAPAATNLQQTSTDPSSGTPGSTGSAAADSLAGILGQLITTPPFAGGSIPGISGGTTSTNRGGTAPGSSGSPTTVPGSSATSNILQQLLSKAGVAAPGIFGAIQNQNTNQWNQAAKISTLNYLQQLGAQAQSSTAQQQANYLPQMANQVNTSQSLLNNTQGALNGNINSALGNVSGAFTGSKDPYSTVPGLQDVINQLQGIQGQGSTAANNLQSNLTSGPLTAGLNNAENISAGNTPTQGSLSSLAAMLTGGGTGVLGQPNAATQQAQSAAGNILGTNPLLSMGQVQSMAVDQNATQSLNAENALRKQLLDRTGVTGPAIASGSQNELLGSGMDQALQNQASGLTAATLGQQNLQNQLYSTGANLFSSSQNAGLNQQQLALQQLLGGAGILSGNQNSQISALNSLSSLGGTQNQGYNSLSSLLGTQSGTSQGAGSLLSGAANLGNTQTNDLYTQLNNLLSQQSGLAGQAQNGLLGAAQFPQNTTNQNNSLLQTLVSGNVGLFGNVPAQTTANNLFNTLSGVNAGK